jgi:hypothetical protein
MGQVSEALTLFLTAVVITTIGIEITRRQRFLREVYDVLDVETKHVVAELEGMVEQGKLQPYTGETWA